MTAKIVQHTTFLVLATCLTIATATPQGVATIWINVSDNAAMNDTLRLYMVNSPDGTYGKDSLSPAYQEIVYPPGYSFDARWVMIAPTEPGEYRSGFIPLDIRGIPSDPSAKDTFQLFVANGDHSAALANFRIDWPDAGFLACRCDSMYLVDKTGQLADTFGNPINVNMYSTSHLVIAEPLATFPTGFQLTIYKYGVHLVDSLEFCLDPDCGFLPKTQRIFRLTDCTVEVKDLQKTIPQSFRLEQNYPNPFNPTTHFSFSIPHKSFVTLRIFDILGRELALLVRETKEPGVYDVPWSAWNISSGVYFYELLAGNYRAVRKLILVE